MKQTNKLISILIALAMLLTMAPVSLTASAAPDTDYTVYLSGDEYTNTASAYLASVTDTDGNEVGRYLSFADAVTAAQANEGSTLTLLDDITVEATQYLQSCKFTLDLNGKTLKNESGAVISIYTGAELTIRDSGTGGTIERVTTGGYAIWNYGTLTFEAGTVKGDGGITNRGTLNFKNGTAEAVTYSAIENRGTAEIYDGALISEDSAALNNGTAGTVNVNGGEMDGIINRGTVYISGGEIDRDDYAALNLFGGTVEITGGSLSGTDSRFGSHSGTPYGEWTVSYTEGAILTLKGGEFPGGFVADETIVNSSLADGYAYYDKDGNKITVADDATKIEGYVQVKEYFAACVTDTDGNLTGNYKTLADAVTAARANKDSTLTLLDDITIETILYIQSGEFTLDLNGKTLVSETSNGLHITDDADVTVKDSGSDGTIEGAVTGGYIIWNDGTLTLEAGTVKGDGGICNMGTLNFKNGTVEAGTYYAVDNRGTAEIHDGALKSENSAGLYNGTAGTAYIYDGKLDGIANNGTAYISGGEIDRDDYAALNLLGGTVEITGGSFTGTDDEYGYRSGTPYGEYTVSYTEGATLTLKGGEFPGGFVANETIVNSSLADGYFFRDAEGRVITVADDAKKIDGYAKVSKGADLESEAVVTLDQTQFTYDGTAHEPTVTVKVGGRTLAENTDYTVEYTNNTNAGTATVTVKSAGDYDGETAKDFTIAQREVTVDGAQVLGAKVYDALTYAKITDYGTLENTVEGDDIETDTANVKAFYADKNVGGGKQVSFGGYALKGEDAANYVLASQPEATTASITRKSVTVSATVPDRIYGDSYNADTSRVVITFDGIVDGDEVGYIVTAAFYHAHTVTDNAPVQVCYNVTGAHADNYAFPEAGEYVAPNYGVIAVGKVLPRDIAQAEISLGDALTYNGEEQTQTIAGVTVVGKNVTYDISGNTATNAGVYELTITGNGNFTGTKTALYEIAPDTSKVDALTVDNVKSSDTEAIEALAQQLESAELDLADEETKAEYEALADKCEQLLEKIAETEAKLNEIKGVKNTYDPDTVTSDDKADIEDILAEIEAVNPDNLTEEQKAEYNEIKADFEALLGKIEAIEAAVDAIGAELEMLDEKRVTVFWEDEIEALKAKADELLAGENIGTAETARLEEYKARCDELIEIIHTPVEYLSLRLFYLVYDFFVWVVNAKVGACTR